MKLILLSLLFSFASLAKANYCYEDAVKVIKSHFAQELNVLEENVKLEEHDSSFNETYGTGEYYFDAIIDGTYFGVELHMIAYSDEDDNLGKCEVQELVVD